MIVGVIVKVNYITDNIQDTQTESNNKNKMEGASYDGPTDAVQVSYSTTDQTVICVTVCFFAFDAYKLEWSIYS